MFPARFVVKTGSGEHKWKGTSVLKLREGLAWQTTAIARYVHEGLIESRVHSLDDSIAVMRTIDEVRRQLGVT